MKLNRDGFITNYLVSGPRTTEFKDESGYGSEHHQLRYEQYLRSIVAARQPELPVQEIQLGKDSRLSCPWEYYYSYGNCFVDRSMFYSTLQKIELDAVTELIADCDLDLTAIIWTYAAVTIWCNGEIICTIEEPVYKPIRKQETVLKLKTGRNRIYIQLQNLGVRDTRNLFGIQLSGETSAVRTGLPGQEQTEALYELEQWLNGIVMKESVLIFPAPAGPDSRLGYDNRSPDYAKRGKRISWEPLDGREWVRLDSSRHGIIHITATAGDGNYQLTRTIENIEAQKPLYSEAADYFTNKQLILERIAGVQGLSRGDKYGFSISNILARKALGCDTAEDERLLAETLDQIEHRYDCSDFVLCGMIRYMKHYPLPARLEVRAREVLLNYRYWMDQKGTDAMCFWSENHSLMFYICAMNAGELYPDDYFPRAGMTGRELHADGRNKVLCWLADVREHGFEEFLSTVYMCITFAALLNVIDYSDPEVSQQATEVTDQLLMMLARHTFDGVVLAPMGRVYREVIHPFHQGAQALINLIDPTAPYSYGEGWLGYYATSGYQLPITLKALIDQPAETSYSTGNALIHLKKTKDYCMTSVQSPRTDPGFVRWENLTLKEDADVSGFAYTKSFNERFHGTTCFEPGVYGYQQHMWYAALNNETAVFTNHPGCSCEDSSTRPGFWYGNGVMPAVYQQDNVIGIVYHIPVGHPIHFTHAYFPAVKFEEPVIEENWLFGKKKHGYLALWCSEPMEAASDWLSGCEYRSYGDDIAYYCICDSSDRFEDMGEFMKTARACKPEFNRAERTLVAGALTISYRPSDDETQYV